MVKVSKLAIALTLGATACPEYNAVEAAEEIYDSVVGNAWETQHEPAMKAIVEGCHPGAPTPDEWYFQIPGPGDRRVRSLGPTHPPGSASAEKVEVDRCIDQGLAALPPYPKQGRPLGRFWFVRLNER
jgi:hypothetical protein